MPPTPESILRTFMEDPRWPPGAMTYHELQGLVFALASAPGPLPPAAWMPIAAPLKQCASPEECEAFQSALMDVYGATHAAVIERRAALPADCPFRQPPLANLEHDAPVAQWSRGFMVGHLSMKPSWDTSLPQHVVAEFKALLLTLGFFATRESAERLCVVTGSHATEAAAVVAECFPAALSAYAQYGRTLQLLMATPDVDAAVGRQQTTGIH
jgi:yecA family protein